MKSVLVKILPIIIARINFEFVLEALYKVVYITINISF